MPIGTYPEWMGESGEEREQIDPLRKGFGMRLAAARKQAKREDGRVGYTQDEVAVRFSVNKATVSAWETGRGAPDAYVLRALAKLYGVSSDALLWEDSLSPDAMKIAAEFDHLPQAARDRWKILWLGFVARGAEGGEQLPAAPAEEPKQNSQAEEREDAMADRLFDENKNLAGRGRSTKRRRVE